MFHDEAPPPTKRRFPDSSAREPAKSTFAKKTLKNYFIPSAILILNVSLGKGLLTDHCMKYCFVVM